MSHYSERFSRALFGTNIVVVVVVVIVLERKNETKGENQLLALLVERLSLNIPQELGDPGILGRRLARFLLSFQGPKDKIGSEGVEGHVYGG